MRKLTIRERVLLAFLLVLGTISAYVLLFYMPFTQQIETLQGQISQAQELNTQLETKLAKKDQMEKTVNDLEKTSTAPAFMPQYDNLQSIMTELNRILSPCKEYSLSFQTEQPQEYIFCRRVTMPFTCTDYAQALSILESLHKSPLRSLLGDVQLTQEKDGSVKATAVVTFYEYRENTDNSSSSLEDN